MKWTVCLSRENKGGTTQVYNCNHLTDVGKVMGDSDFLKQVFFSAHFKSFGKVWRALGATSFSSQRVLFILGLIFRGNCLDITSEHSTTAKIPSPISTPVMLICWDACPFLRQHKHVPPQPYFKFKLSYIAQYMHSHVQCLLQRTAVILPAHNQIRIYSSLSEFLCTSDSIDDIHSQPFSY